MHVGQPNAQVVHTYDESGFAWETARLNEARGQHCQTEVSHKLQSGVGERIPRARYLDRETTANFPQSGQDVRLYWRHEDLRTVPDRSTNAGFHHRALLG